MTAILFMVIAASLSALANFFVRRNLELQGTAEGYLFASFGCSLIIGIATHSQIFQIPLSLGMFLAGSVAGLLIVLLMRFTTQALLIGPSGLTFAFQISGSIFPGIVLFLIFGSAFGYTLNLLMIVGLCLVILGLFLASDAFSHSFSKTSKKWFILAIAIFLIHLAFVTLVQWRCLTFSNVPAHPLILFRCMPEQDVWFMTSMFGTALVVQCGILMFMNQRPKKSDLKYGSLGGFANGVGTYLFLMATGIASPMEKGILFPLFSIVIILVCNLWSQVLYAENINWKANLLCLSGILTAYLWN